MGSHTPVRRDTFPQHWKPRTPRAGNLAHTNRCMTRAEALTRRHIQINAERLHNVIVLDLDRSDGMGIMDAFDLVGRGVIPPFNWATESKSGGAHLAYVLAAGVAWSERAREAPKRYFEDVRAVLTEAAGADAAYRNYMTYNPLHPATDARWLRQDPWTLQDLHLALRPDGDPLVTHQHHGTSTDTAEHGESRHQTLFDELRRHAYVSWDTHYVDQDGKGLGRLTHQAAVIAEGHRLNELNWPAFPLPEREVESIARNVAAWTWTRFHKDSKSERRTARVMKTRHVQTRAARIAELREALANGVDVTEAYIRETYGVARPTALSYIKQLGVGKAARLAPFDAEVRRRLEAGESIAAIVRATGMTRDQVRYSAQRQGLRPASSTKRPPEKL